MYYSDGKLYFVDTPNADEVYTYFLHYYPIERDVINNDFEYTSKKLVTSFWKNSIAVMDIPQQSLNSVEFGQYYNDTRFWEYSIDLHSFVEEPQVLYLSDYSNDDWNYGYSNSENCFLINNLDIGNYFVKGKGLLLQDGNTARITDVTEVAGYIRVYTDIKLENVSIREYQVIV